MTVSYALVAATASSGATFLGLLWRWKGSVWKLLAVELAIWLVLVILNHLLYLFIIRGSELQQTYDVFVAYVTDVPFKGAVTLLLSFSTSANLSRWLDVYRLLAWPDNAVLMFNAYFEDHKVTKRQSVMIRSTVARYIMMSFILVLRDVSTGIRKRFPTFDHLVMAGIASDKDIRLLNVSGMDPDMCQYFTPLVWVITLVKGHCRRGVNSVMNQYEYLGFASEITRIRSMLGDILAYDWIPVPLALTQTITFSVYLCLVLSIFDIHSNLESYSRFPSTTIITTLFWNLFEAIFYMGWLKCSQVVLNPFGQDDDDFEANWLIDRHWRVLNSWLKTPETYSSNITDVVAQSWLPHTLASARITRTSDISIVGSLARKRIKTKDMERFESDVQFQPEA